MASLSLPEHNDNLGRTENHCTEGGTKRDPEAGNRTCSNVQSSPSAHATLPGDAARSHSAAHRHKLA